MSQPERSVFRLALRLEIKLENAALLGALVSVLKRMKELGDMLYLEMKNGMMLAWTISDLAVSEGITETRDWRNDHEHGKFLGRFMSGRGS